MAAEEKGASRLGRGLAALIGDAETSEVMALDRARTQRRVPIEMIVPNPRNPRQEFDEEELQDLVNSVLEKGVVQPLLVRNSPEGNGRYELIAGERRWRAAQRAGLHEVPCLIHDVDDREALELAIIENVQRADLNALEEALGYQRLIEDYSYSQNDLARVIGKSRSHVANTLRLLKLPDDVLALLRSGKLTAGHARTLVSLPDPSAAAQRIVESGLSVRQAEEAAGKDAGRPAKKAKAPETKSTDTLALEKRLTDILGLVVTINDKGGAGEVRIRYRDLEQLDRICSLLEG
ncbi:MAG: ParB/RepB/Spo0J family partition protein [Rhodobiaceae bacterium]|nr:ParB/RepB/Spo0J family partition protein [Rhodobiaceae bacterium]MCC0012572.1 ParB/RepB/Spo0J family partition protein [Rhodobiaceae bacterium]MCC0050713.1 ParB/RepB/Spo0J family partition protein [Rhodobiaceae bacterium]MCC0061779.1 ParB/RepB/Spo0J family partition protein [Rhodobiaceae bacterium]